MTEKDVPEMADPSRLLLPSILDFSFCGELFVELGDHLEGGVFLDASGVRHLGACCVQVLLSASRRWKADNALFVVEPRSEAFVLGLERMGIGADEFPGSDAAQGSVQGPAQGPVQGPSEGLISGPVLEGLS